MRVVIACGGESLGMRSRRGFSAAGERRVTRMDLAVVAVARVKHRTSKWQPSKTAGSTSRWILVWCNVVLGLLPEYHDAKMGVLVAVERQVSHETVHPCLHVSYIHTITKPCAQEPPFINCILLCSLLAVYATQDLVLNLLGPSPDTIGSRAEQKIRIGNSG